MAPDDDGGTGGDASVSIGGGAPSCIGVWEPNDTDDIDTNDTDDLPTLTADGSDPDGTYSWTVVQGGDKLTFVDADPDDGLPAAASPTVRLQGVAASEAVNDVKIEVTHTTADGSDTDTAMIELTVILATLTFRADGVWSDNNDIDPDPANGDPTLGAVTPSDPAGTLGFFQNVEIEASLQPCLAGLDCSFEFKQEKQGWAVTRNPDGSFDTNNLLSCSPGADADNWCDDSPLPESEDTAVDVAEGCALYTVDSPGVVTQGSLCPDGSNGLTLAQCMRFRTWLTADGVRVSGDTIRWNARAEATCDFVWSGTNTIYGNSVALGEGEVCENPDPLVPFVAGAEGGGEAPEAPIDALAACRTLVEAADSQRRTAAYLKIERAIRDGELKGNQRDEVIRVVLRAARIEKERYENLSATELSIRLLGQLRAEAAIPVLLRQVDEGFGARLVLDRRDVHPPAANALADIGEPAIAPMLEQCATASKTRWGAMITALKQIDHRTPAVREAMRTLLEAQADFPAPENEEEAERRQRVKQRLEEFLKTPEPKRPKPEPGPVSRGPAPVNIDRVELASE